MTDLQKQIAQAADLIRQASHTVALTGAGISTPSGIPDFRSPGSGLWSQVNPMEVASSIAFRQQPEKFYDWVKPLAEKVLAAQPNSAHQALAQLEQSGKLAHIITQNIDGLHQAAGSKEVLEVHGHIREFTCVGCYKVHPAEPVLKAFFSNGDIPHCDCGGVLKPNVILFGEQLPVQTILDARTVIQAADLIIVVGSSLEVAPISNLPHEALEKGSKLIIINLQETYLDARADVVIRQEVTEILPQIMENLGEG